MTAEQNYLEQRVLRTLLRREQMIEGRLAAFCQRRMFEQSWRECVTRLTAEGLLSCTPTGHGVAQTLALTEAGKAKAQAAKVKANEQAAKEILEAAEEAVTGGQDAVKETVTEHRSTSDWLKSL